MAGSPNFVSGLVERIKRSLINRIIAVIALFVVGGASYAVKMVTGGHSAAPEVATVAAPAKTARAPKAEAAVNTAPEVTDTPAPAPSTPAQAVSNGENGAPVVHSVTSEPVTSGPEPVHMDDHLTYQYNALGRRDPFQSLVEGEFVGADVGGDAPPDVGGIKVVGIVWGATDQFALVEDVRGNSFVLRKGDKVQNGYVEGLKRDGVIVNLTAEGQSQSVVIPLVRKGDSNAR